MGSLRTRTLTPTIGLTWWTAGQRSGAARSRSRARSRRDLPRSRRGGWQAARLVTVWAGVKDRGKGRVRVRVRVRVRARVRARVRVRVRVRPWGG